MVNIAIFNTRSGLMVFRLQAQDSNYMVSVYWADFIWTHHIWVYGLNAATELDLRNNFKYYIISLITDLEKILQLPIKSKNRAIEL